MGFLCGWRKGIVTPLRLALCVLAAVGAAAVAGEAAGGAPGAVAGGAAVSVAATPADAWRIEVLDAVEVPKAWSTRELSGLAWVPPLQQLLAVSDRGRLWRLAVTWPGVQGQERLQLDRAIPVADLPGDKAAPKVNAEAVAWQPSGLATSPGRLLVADEAGHRVLVLDVAGSLEGTRPVPGPSDQAERLHNRNAGIEALAWHPTRGLLAATQRPLVGSSAAAHRLHAEDGSTWTLQAAGGKAAVKAIEVLDAQTLLVLERVKEGDGWKALLRPIDLTTCLATAVCNPPVLAVTHPALQGRDNFEGLACVTQDLCLLVSDDGQQRRTMLVLLRLHRPGADVVR